jgi:nucleotide-binding universal stress UspA family protein
MERHVTSPRRILIAVDGSPLAADALEVGIALGRAIGGEIALVCVVDPAANHEVSNEAPESDAQTERRREGHMELEAAASLLDGRPVSRFLREGQPPDEILSVASEWGAHFIVLGASGSGDRRHHELGATACAVASGAHCPVLVVPRGEG